MGTLGRNFFTLGNYKAAALPAFSPAPWNGTPTGAFVPLASEGIYKSLKNKSYYIQRAAYMRDVARYAQTGKLKESAIKAAEQLEALAKLAERDQADADEDED